MEDTIKHKTFHPLQAFAHALSALAKISMIIFITAKKPTKRPKMAMLIVYSSSYIQRNYSHVRPDGSNSERALGNE